MILLLMDLFNIQGFTDRKALAGKTMDEARGYLDLLNGVYAPITKALSEAPSASEERTGKCCTAQMMIAKGLAFRQLLDGIGYRKGNVELPPTTDYTTLFALVRCMFEQLMSFEIVNVIPNTEDKKLILYNVYRASGLTTRKNLRKKACDEEESIIEACREKIRSCELYKNLDDEGRTVIRQEMEKGEYQLLISDDGKVKHIALDEVRSYCNMKKNILDTIHGYCYAMAQPSCFSLSQSQGPDKGPFPNPTELVIIASMQAAIVMGIFVAEFMRVFPEAKTVFGNSDEVSQAMVKICAMMYIGN
jgi:hypothetical protein